MDSRVKVKPSAVGRDELRVHDVVDHPLVVDLRQRIAVQKAAALCRVRVAVDVELQRARRVQLRDVRVQVQAHMQAQRQQAQQQAEIEAKRQSDMAQLYEPYQRLGFLSDIYKGAPTSQQTLTSSTAPGVSPAQQFLGLGIAGLSAASGAQKAGLFG